LSLRSQQAWPAFPRRPPSAIVHTHRAASQRRRQRRRRRRRPIRRRTRHTSSRARRAARQAPRDRVATSAATTTPHRPQRRNAPRGNHGTAQLRALKAASRRHPRLPLENLRVRPNHRPVRLSLRASKVQGTITNANAGTNAKANVPATRKAQEGNRRSRMKVDVPARVPRMKEPRAPAPVRKEAAVLARARGKARAARRLTRARAFWLRS
jgi:hypothetical protein